MHSCLDFAAAVFSLRGAQLEELAETSEASQCNSNSLIGPVWYS